MTARIVNLRTRRKQKARATRKEVADANALQHGRTKAETNLTQARNALEDHRLDGKKQDDDS